MVLPKATVTRLVKNGGYPIHGDLSAIADLFQSCTLLKTTLFCRYKK